MRHITSFLIFLVATTAVSEEQQITRQQRAAMERAAACHAFITVDGEEISGRPIDFMAEKDSVELKTADGSTCIIKLPILSEKDQAFVRDWNSAYSLFARRKVRVSLKKNMIENLYYYGYNNELDDRKTLKSMFPEMEYEKLWRSDGHKEPPCHKIGYDILIENNSDRLLSGIKIEYCIYQKIEIKNEMQDGVFQAGTSTDNYTDGGFSAKKRTKLPDQIILKQFVGEFFMERLLDGYIYTNGTETVKVLRDRLTERYREYTRSDSTQGKGRPEKRFLRIIDSDFLGIRYRVYIPTPSGEYAMMEFADPENLIDQTEWLGAGGR